MLNLILLLGSICLVSSCGPAPQVNETNNAAPNDDPIVSPRTEDQSEDQNLSETQLLGKRLFIMCEACHSVAEEDAHKVGPNLHNIFGRTAGTRPGFTYSEALLASDITWSDETIRAWLQDPNGYIPGTNMVFVGLPKKDQQDALLEYLHYATQ